METGCERHIKTSCISKEWQIKTDKEDIIDTAWKTLLDPLKAVETNALLPLSFWIWCYLQIMEAPGQGMTDKWLLYLTHSKRKWALDLMYYSNNTAHYYCIPLQEFNTNAGKTENLTRKLQLHQKTSSDCFIIKLIRFATTKGGLEDTLTISSDDENEDIILVSTLRLYICKNLVILYIKKGYNSIHVILGTLSL